jgi:cytochrome c-type biogenesis protein CcmH/NrfG
MNRKRRRHPRQSSRKGDKAQLAAELAPLEELDREAARKQGQLEEANPEQGAIVVDTRKMQLPRGVDQAGEGKTSWRIEPVVIVVAGLLLLYLVYITWQISLMP